MLADKDVDDTMAADWAAIREKHTVEIEEETPASPDPSQGEQTHEGASGEAASPSQETRARDQSGKFVKAEEKPNEKSATRKPGGNQSNERGAASAVAGSSGDDAGKPVLPETTPAGTERDINRAPSSWKPTARAEFEKLSPLIKAEIHRRESDFMAGHSQLLPDAQLGKSLRDVMAPYQMLIQSEGGTPETTVRDLLRTAAVFRTGSVEQKYQALAGVAQKFGLDITVFGRQQGQVQTGQQGQSQQPFRDPRVDQILAQQQRDTVQRQQREQAEMENTVTGWMNEVDAQGNPTRPYIGDVITDMSALIPQIKQSNPALTNAQALEEAYNRAIWANPEIRTLLQQKAAADLDAQRRSESQTRVRDARRAASVNVPRRASLPNAAKPTSLEDTIASTARELGLIT